jgi:hypothetical protein
MQFTVKNYIPVESEAVGTPTHTFTKRVHAIRADVDGTVQARLRGDGVTDWRAYTLVAGEYLFGEFAAIQASSFGGTELVGLVFPLD